MMILTFDTIPRGHDGGETVGNLDKMMCGKTLRSTWQKNNSKQLNPNKTGTAE
jgi:hypothetical protein